jgi:hypothetical protein
MSFFVSETAQDLSRCALGTEDIYLRYWAATLVPLYDAGGAWSRFLSANGWMHDRLPGLRPATTAAMPSRAPGRRTAALGGRSPRWTRPLLPLLRSADAHARKIQMRMFPKEIARMANLDSRVIVSDDMLKFHVNDRREEFGRAFSARLREFETPVAIPA